jgi:hypothetical protein
MTLKGEHLEHCLQNRLVQTKLGSQMGTEPVEHSERDQFQAGEGCTVEALIERHQALAIKSCMPTDDEAGKNPAQEFLFAPLPRALKWMARDTPDLAARIPNDAKRSSVIESIEHLLRASRPSQQLCIDSPGASKRTSLLR